MRRGRTEPTVCPAAAPPAPLTTTQTTMAKIRVTRRGADASTQPDAPEAIADGTYVVTTPSDTFGGTRLGVGFAEGRGLATAEQAQQLAEVFGYDIERVADGIDETAEVAARLAEVLTPADDAAPEVS